MRKEDVVHVYNEILLSHINESDLFVMMWKNLDSVIRSEVSQKNKYCILTHIYGIRKMVLMNLYVGQVYRHRHREWTYEHRWVRRG